jgi:transcription initiation factor TFIIIB Brf1 subunit/transcription initiation factor TFIIB
MDFDMFEDLEACFLSIEDEEEEKASIDYDKCPECNKLMFVKTNNQYVCNDCGYLKENVEVLDMSTINSDMNYNYVASGLRCVGANAYKYQNILRTHSSNDASPELHVRNILFTYNHAVGKDGAIPKDVLLTVCEQYKQIRSEGTIYRGTILRAILAAMVYYECLKRKMIYKPSDIYTWFDVDPPTYSKGDKKIREMLDHGHFSENLREINAECSYLHAYASKLNLSETHIEFIIKLMELVTKYKLLNPNAKSSTRALCTLHLYLTAVKHSIRPDEFKEMFKCNFGTIRTIALDLLDRMDKLIPLFEEYEINYDGIKVYGEKSKKIVNKRRSKTSRIALDEEPSA